MKIIDKTPIEQPAVGRLVTLNNALGSLADCCLYLLPEGKALASDVEKAVAYLSGSDAEGAYLNEYDFEALEDNEALKGQVKLQEGISGENANLLMPLKTPHTSEKQYLVAHADKDDVITKVSLMLYTSERVSKHSYGEVLHQYALTHPDDFCDTLETQFENNGLWTRVAQGIAGGLSAIAFGSTMGIVPSGETSFSPRSVSFRKKTEMLDRMKDNIKKFRKNRDPQAEAELSFLLDGLDKDTLLAILTALPKQQLEVFYKTANPRLLAEKSKMKLEVKYVGSLDRKFRTNGYYRLFLAKDMDQVQVHFKYKESFVVYLIYLIDKLQKEEVDSLSIKDYQPQFLSLYGASYNDTEADALDRFTELFRSLDKNGDFRQAQLKHCYSDIRTSLSAACAKMEELPAPYILQNYHDHLYVLRENIIVENKLVDLFNSAVK